jgi:TRAP-type C4-dicarboxylate transport system permease small subunit
VKKLVSALVFVQETLGMVLLTIFFLAILAQISARYLGIPLLWTEEVANYSFIWAVFMGASVMIHYKAHFAFNFFRDKFSGRTAALYDLVIYGILLCFTIPMAWYGIVVTTSFWHYNWITLPWVKMGYTWLCLPITGCTMTIYASAHILEDIRIISSGREAIS